MLTITGSSAVEFSSVSEGSHQRRPAIPSLTTTMEDLKNTTIVLLRKGHNLLQHGREGRESSNRIDLIALSLTNIFAHVPLPNLLEDTPLMDPDECSMKLSLARMRNTT